MSNQLKWDLRWLKLAKEVSTWSKDPSTQVGAVIVKGKNEFVSLGYNGFPMDMDDDPALYANREEKLRRIIHAEMNAEGFAVKPINECTMYCTLLPCDRCFIHLIQNRKIVRFVSSKPTPEQEQRWGASFEWVRNEAKKLGLELIELDVDINLL